MAQFDVYRTMGANRRAAPYLVSVQSNRLDRLPTRIVIPLVYARAGGDFDDALAPPFEIEGVQMRLAPWQIFTIPLAALGPVVASLSSDTANAKVVRGIDEAISQAYRPPSTLA